MNLSQILPKYHLGCSDIGLEQAKDGTSVCGRGMDYPVNMNSQLLFFNEGEENQSVAPDGSTGLTWTSRYGYAGINAFGLSDVDEGLNTQGLSFGVLSLQETVYPTVQPQDYTKALAIIDVGKWILGTCATIEEVKEALQSVVIWGEEVAVLKQVPLLHIALHDAAGNSAVIEFLKGKVKFYDNPVGILTNDPPFKWHRTNLTLHTGASTNAPPNVTMGAITIKSLAETGLNAQPGGCDPTHRFVQLFNAKRFMPQAQDSTTAVKLAWYALDKVKIIPGQVTVSLGGQSAEITTQWGAVKDMSNRVFYYRGTDLVVHFVDLKRIDFSKGTPHKPIPIQSATPAYRDMTEEAVGIRV